MRVVSYNIHKGIGGRDRRYRFERIAEVIEHLQPDVVCLQEVDHNVRRTRFDHQPDLLAARLNAVDAFYQHNVHLKMGGYGNLIISGWPFRSKHQISLRLKSKKPRGAQAVVIDTPQGPLHLVNWHLGLAERERSWQVHHLLTHSSFREAHELPTLIIGDYNDWRNRLKHESFAEHGFEQITSPPSRFRSFPAYLPLGSLDKAFYRGAISIDRAFIAHSALAKNASDHLPLVVDFDLGSNGSAGV
ncbi:MAG TPA: endonuclease/exonuclease/phosphatase family protein [Pirellulales bacterium]